MNLDIISIGDELLIGQTLNTNAHWISKELNKVGFVIRQQTSISDEKQHIINTLDDALKNVEVVLITGGLGPTKDDLTMTVLNEYFGGTLIRNKKVYDHIEKLVLSRGFEMNQYNQKQALVPDNCKVVENANGTAPGLWFEKGNKVVVAMPGVPYEMRAMISNTIIPWLKRKYDLPEIVHQMIYTQGLAESSLAEILEDWENNLPSTIKLAYLPSPGRVKLRLSSVGADRYFIEDRIGKEVEKLQELIPAYIYSVDSEQLEEITGDLLKEKGATLSTAESCTGGYIAHLMTSISGSSVYFKGAIVAYANEIKENQLGVAPSVIKEYGAVSQQVVEKMALGVQEKMNTDYAVATSGVAGPTGGSEEKPVGTVWIAVATPSKVISEKYQFGKDRIVNIERTSVIALGMLRKEL